MREEEARRFIVYEFEEIDRFEITGRGTVISVDKPKYKNQKVEIGDPVIIDGVPYLVTGVEGLAWGAASTPVGLLVRPVEEYKKIEEYNFTRIGGGGRAVIVECPRDDFEFKMRQPVLIDGKLNIVVGIETGRNHKAGSPLGIMVEKTEIEKMEE